MQWNIMLRWRIIHCSCASAYCVAVCDIAGRQRLRSAHRHQLVVPRHQRSTLGCRAFSVAGPIVWNSIPYRVGFLPWQKLFLPGQWKKNGKNRGKNRQKLSLFLCHLGLIVSLFIKMWTIRRIHHCTCRTFRKTPSIVLIDEAIAAIQ